MSGTDSSGIFHPYYIPLKRGTSKVKKPQQQNKNKIGSRDTTTTNYNKGNQNKSTSDCREENRTYTVKIKRKKTHNGKPKIVIQKRQKKSEDDDSFERAVELLTFWCENFEKEMGVPYEVATSAVRLQLCDKILEKLNFEKAKTFIRLLLFHPDLGWVGQKTLEWLSKPANQTRVATISRKRVKSTRAEYSGERSSETKITFRSI